MKTVVGMFDDLLVAQEVVEALMDTGFTRDDISLVAHDHGGEYGTAFGQDVSDEVAESTATGAIAGGAIGGLAGLLVGLGALTIPGIGPVVAAGPIVAGLTGAGIGAAAGGIFGALVGWGIPESEAELYAEGVRRGGVIVAVRAPENQVQRAVEMMSDYDPIDVQRRSEYWREEGWTAFSPQAEPLTAEQIDRERNRYNRYNAQSDVDYGEYEEYEEFEEYDYDTFEPFFQEHYQTTYANQGHAYDRYHPAYRYGYLLATDERYYDRDWGTVEPEARRHWESEHQGAWEEFKDTVRHAWEEVKSALSGDDDDEDFEYDEEAYELYESSFRSHYDTNYATSEYAYNQYQPAYRYGCDLATDYRYRDRAWDDVEPEARHRWEEVNPDTWEEFKESVRHGWEEAKR